MDMAFSCRKNAFFQAPIKLAQPFPAPELRTKIFTDTRIFPKSLHQKTFLGRVRVKFAQNEGHEKATKKPRKNHEKGPNTVFPRR